MVLIRPDAFDFDLVALADLVTKTHKFCFDFRAQQGASVADHKNEVIVNIVSTVIVNIVSTMVAFA